MFFNNPSDIFDYLLGFLNKGDAVADATVGNGNDTLKLSNAVGKSGRVYGFDIQSAAIESAKKQEYAFENVQFINATHSDADKYIKEELAAAVFNLGISREGITVLRQRRRVQFRQLKSLCVC